jgi:hypothetical protein
MYLIYYFFCLTFAYMSEKLFKKIIDTLYPDYNITIKSFEVLDRHQFNGSEWVKDTPCLFIGANILNCNNLEKLNDNLSSFTSCEINIFKI